MLIRCSILKYWTFHFKRCFFVSSKRPNLALKEDSYFQHQLANLTWLAIIKLLSFLCFLLGVKSTKPIAGLKYSISPIKFSKIYTVQQCDNSVTNPISCTHNNEFMLCNAVRIWKHEYFFSICSCTPHAFHFNEHIQKPVHFSNGFERSKLLNIFHSLDKNVFNLHLFKRHSLNFTWKSFEWNI